MEMRQGRIFTVAPNHNGTLTLKAASMAASVVDHVFSFPKVDDLYRSISDRETGSSFCKNIMRELDLKIQVSDSDLARVPSGGPTVVVANHPFGLLDPMILYVTLRELRPDVKVITNFMMSRVKELHDFCIFVDPFGGPQAQKQNAKAVRETLDWLSGGGMVVMFPAGEVAALTSRNWQVTEPDWNISCARFARKTGASVVPVLFKGTNCPVFHLAGLVHPRLRTALLPHELVNKRNMEIRLAIGHPISADAAKSFPTDEAATSHFRQRTFHLKNRWKFRPLTSVMRALPQKAMLDVAEHPDNAALATEAKLLPRECTMLEAGEHTVYCATAKQIPHILVEIGRQRELTFRETGEGSGLALDLDEFDQDYLHLFLWNHAAGELVGAYRLGPTDKIKRPNGFYVQTLFKIHPRLLDQLRPGLELGRSFVHVKYQRTSSALAMLWKGLAKYVSMYPKYQLLFGPVSISKDYEAASRQMIVRYLERHHYDPLSAVWVKPRTPFRKKDALPFTGRLPMMDPTTISELSDLVSDLESDGKGVPVLIREYLRLGGQVMGFNVDPNFSDVVDGLILVDLTKTPKRTLDRYMGHAEAEKFREYHRKATTGGLSKLLAA
jgi:putative hemolysin